MKQQARFWVYHKSGVVRIKLNRGQTVWHSEGGPTDEGYSWTARGYSYDGVSVAVDWRTESRDCDGRMTRTGSSYCAVGKLASHFVDGMWFPVWEHSETGQRDYSAEAMGY